MERKAIFVYVEAKLIKKVILSFCIRVIYR